jgi:uncharacterized membrane protein HdeD (DUF308 family)
MTTGAAKAHSLMSHTILECLLNIKRILLKNMRRSNKGSNWLIIIGILGIIAALIVGLLIWRAILG